MIGGERLARLCEGTKEGAKGIGENGLADIGKVDTHGGREKEWQPEDSEEYDT